MFRSLVLRAAIPIILLFLSSCANLNTIDRTTYLENNTAKAIHLDVQQRLLIVNNMGKYCAEPSPDALASFAAAVGLGVSAPSSGAASISGGGQSTAASIGLRTQSITLMRDALYRMCEAYGNGAIGEAQVVTLLNRSQDLTAVILAVEQLTGAVAANQTALTGSSGSSGFATALDNSKLLTEATANEARVLSRLEGVKSEKEAAAVSYQQAETLLTKVQADLKELESATPQDSNKILAAKSDITFRKNFRNTTAATLNSANARVELYQKAYDRAQSITAEIGKRPNSSLASSSANTTGAAQFTTPTSRIALDKDATVAISSAVRDMVLRVLDKDYVLDSCMSIITSNHKSSDQDTRDYCKRLVNALVQEKAILAETRVEKAKAARIQENKDDATQIINCIAPTGRLEQRRRDQLFADANTDGKLLKILVTTASDISQFRTMLGQNSNIRIAMAAKVNSSTACK